jgi:8-oxo-dGTP pyrophosphatase MutT (NUDIX family)
MPKDDESLHAATQDVEPIPVPRVAVSHEEAMKVSTDDLRVSTMHEELTLRDASALPKIVRYVCGFAMGPNDVLLLTKAKPEWQRGKLNGVGGRVETSDAGLRAAMEREFLEETGVHVRAYNWTLFHTERFGAYGQPVGEVNRSRLGQQVNCEVYFFYARVGPAIMQEACENTVNSAEPCSVHEWDRVGAPDEHPVHGAALPCIANLPYLLRMADHYWQNMMADEEWKNASPYIAKEVKL